MTKGFIRFLFISLLSVCFAGCSSLLRELFGEDHSNDFQASAAKAFYDDGLPRLRTGVIVLIQVSAIGQQPSAMQAQVDQNGSITLQYLIQEPIQCAGLTLEEFKQKLIDVYAVYIKQPVISVSFGAFDGQTGVSPYGWVTVLGEVASPGPVNMPATLDLTVTKALKLSGWFRPYADKNNICVTRRYKNGDKKQFFIDIDEIGEKGLIQKDIVLRSGDVIWVPTQWY